MSLNPPTNFSSESPIGVFDSGVGGLSILDKIHQLLPNEQLLYLADSAHAPYGQKTEAEIQQRCLAIMEFFIEKQVKAVVLACNTATAAAVVSLREKFDLPIIGMEPAVKPAAEQSLANIVGVLATAGTIDSDKFIKLKSQFSDEVEIITKACPGLVEQIEQKAPDRLAIKALLKEFALPLLDKGADTLVLGCTHYSLISDLISEVVGAQVKIIDTGFAVAKELERRLQENNLKCKENQGQVQFYSTDAVQVQAALMSSYWSKPVAVFAVKNLLPSHK